MSRRNRNWQGGQTTAPGYYNPDALPASQQLTMASLDSICENVTQAKQMVQNGQPTGVPLFRHGHPQVRGIDWQGFEEDSVPAPPEIPEGPDRASWGIFVGDFSFPST